MARPGNLGQKWITLHSSILVQFLLILIPMIAFSAILLGLVYIYAWSRRRAPIEGLNLDSGYVSGYLYVDFSATRLILVASWSSSVAIPLIGSLCNLASYVVAADMAWSSRLSLHGLLPSPPQLALLTDLLDAKKLAIFIWISEIWSRANTAPSRWMIEFPAMVQIAGLVLSGAILAADTWLHVATSSVTMNYLSKIDDTASMGPMYTYSRNLTDDCAHSYYDACSVVLKGPNNETAFPSGIKDLIEDNPLSTTRINQTADGTYFLAPRLSHSRDANSNDLNWQTYSATTLGSSARCEKDLTMCSFDETVLADGNFTYACSGGMNGTFRYPDWLGLDTFNQYYNYTYYQAYWGSSGLSSNLHLGVVAFLENNTVEGARTVNFVDGDGRNRQGTIFAGECYVDMVSFSYDWTNATDRPTLKNPEMNIQAADVARAPVLVNYIGSDDFDHASSRSIWNKLGLSDQEPSDVDAALMLSSMEQALGYLGLSLLGGTFKTMEPTALSLANSTVVTQVAKMPLFTLVILNFWYATFGAVLFGLSLYILRDKSIRQDIIEVQQLITVNGLATAAVKRQRNNLTRGEANLRVGVEKIDNEWQFRVWDMGGRGETKSLLSEQAVSNVRLSY